VTPRAARAAILGAVAAFAALEGTAMAIYSGGTTWDAHTAGYRFWQNYLCDLLRQRALDGAPNAVGARLASAAMLVILLGLVSFWIAFPRVVPGSILARAARVLGLTSVAGVVAVVLLPSDRYGALHGVAVVLAGAPGLTASALAVAALLRHERPPRALGAIGAAWVVAALADFVLYVRHLAAGDLGTPILPAIQKVALGLLVAWMVAVALRLGQTFSPARSASCSG
jgi:hypothetical protein